MPSAMRAPADDLEALLRELPEPQPGRHRGRALPLDEEPFPFGDAPAVASGAEAAPMGPAAPTALAGSRPGSAGGSAPRAPLLDVPVDADPFAELETVLDVEDTLEAAGDGLGDVRDLFGTRPAARPRAPVEANRAVGGSGWPSHNYNAAYHSIQAEQARHGPRRRKAPPQEHELWEVDSIGRAPSPNLHSVEGRESSPSLSPAYLPPDATPAERDAARIRAALAQAPMHRPSAMDTPAMQSTPWPAQATSTATGDDWLERLGDVAPTNATVAQLVGGVPLHREPPALVDVMDTLFARPRRGRHPVGSMRDVPAAANPPSWSTRALRIATVFGATMFALAILQLIVLSL